MVRITELKCCGLYSYRDPMSVAVPTKAVIVGPNNSGKSNIFRMIRLLVDVLLDPSDLQGGQISKGAADSYLELSMELTKDETDKIVDFFSFYKQYGEVKFFEYQNRAQLIALLDEIRARISLRKTAMSGIQAYAEIEFVKIGLKIYGQIKRSLRVSSSLVREAAPTRVGEEDLPIHELLGGLSEQAGAKKTVAEFFGNREVAPTPALVWARGGVPERGKKVMSDLRSYVDLPEAERRTGFSDLVGKILANSTIHSLDSRHIDVPSILIATKPTRIPAGRERGTKLYPDTSVRHYTVPDLAALTEPATPAKTLASDGSNMSSFLFGLKNSDDLGKRGRFEEIQKEFEKIFKSEKLRFDVILKPQNPAVQGSAGPEPPAHALPIPVTVITNDDLEQFSIADVGAGVRESIYLLALVLGSRDSVVLLDEPSINMHPGLTREILGKISEIEDNQILITTHSPAIVSLAAFEHPARILYVRKSDSYSTVKTVSGKTLELFEKDRNRLRYMLDPGIFFAKCVVLVEGESDRSLIVGVWRRLGIGLGRDLNHNDVLVVPVGGKRGFAKYRKILADFGVPHLILADNDAQKRIGGKAVCKKTTKLEGTAFVIENGDLEDLMRDIDSKAYDKAVRPNRKTVSVDRFLEELSDDGQNLTLFRAMFDKAVCLSKGQF